MELVTGHQATPHITAEQVSRLLQGVTTMDDTTVYRLPIGNNCAVSVSLLDVSIDTGEIVLHGFHTTFEEGYTVTLDPTVDAAKSRIDKIVMEIIEDLTTGIQTANIEVVQGEESSSPVAPATPVAPTSPTEKFLAVGVIATATVSNITIASSVDNTELYAGSYISEEIFGKTVRNQSSDQYNTTKAYKVGDYVIHNDTLYKCITACSAGSWEANQNCFVTDTLTKAVTTLNSDLASLTYTKTNITTGINKFVFSKLKIVIVTFTNASIPLHGIDIGENIAAQPVFMSGYAVADNVVGYIRNYPSTNKLIWKNDEAISDVYGTWIGLIS